MASRKSSNEKVNESDEPADISYTKYKEMLINSVKDIIKILYRTLNKICAL